MEMHQPNLREKAFFLIVLISMCGTSVRGQEAGDAFELFLDQVRQGEQPALPYELLRREEHLDQLLAAIDQSLTDTLTAVREAGYQSLKVIQHYQSGDQAKRSILARQFAGLSDPAPALRSLTIDNLADLSPVLFTADQRIALVNLLGQSVPRKEVLIRLTGRLQVREAIPVFQRLSAPGNSSGIRWAAYLALSRMGEEDGISAIQQKLTALEMNTDVAYAIVPDVIYTRQKPLYDYLVEQLHSEVRNCEPADPDQTEPINCAYRILEMLAPEIEAFPIGTTASGDLSTHNYRQALAVAREWFTANPAYRIRSIE